MTMPLMYKTTNVFKAIDYQKDLVAFNKGRGGQYKYVYTKFYRRGHGMNSYGIVLSKGFPKAKLGSWGRLEKLWG